MSPICPCDSLYKINSVLHCLQTEALALVAAGGMSGVPKTSCTHRGSDGTDSICHLHPFASMCILYDFIIKLYNFCSKSSNASSSTCKVPMVPIPARLRWAPWFLLHVCGAPGVSPAWPWALQLLFHRWPWAGLSRCSSWTAYFSGSALLFLGKL